MSDFVRVAETLSRVFRGAVGSSDWGRARVDEDLDAAIALCERVAQATTEIDQCVEQQHCTKVARKVQMGMHHALGDVISSEREDARLQAIMAAHVAYRELSDAVADFLHSPDSLERLSRAFEKTRGL